jgi:hypothetical protein
VVRHYRWPADCAEEDRVMLFYPSVPVFGHHAAMLGEVFARREIEMVEMQVNSEALGCDLQHAHAFGHNLLADPVAWNDRDPALLGWHIVSPIGQDADDAGARPGRLKLVPLGHRFLGTWSATEILDLLAQSVAVNTLPRTSTRAFG